MYLAPKSPVPNHSHLPVLLVRAAFKGQTPGQIEHALAERGWPRAWRGGIYSFHHDHSTAHEVLVIARVTLGGEGETRLQVGEGDVRMLPAGTGHKNGGSSPALLVVGAYAQVPDWERLPV